MRGGDSPRVHQDSCVSRVLRAPQRGDEGAGPGAMEEDSSRRSPAFLGWPWAASSPRVQAQPEREPMQSVRGRRDQKPPLSILWAVPVCRDPRGAGHERARHSQMQASASRGRTLPARNPAAGTLVGSLPPLPLRLTAPSLVPSGFSCNPAPIN